MSKSHLRFHPHAHKFLHHIERSLGMSVEAFDAKKVAILNTTDRRCEDCKAIYKPQVLSFISRLALPYVREATMLVVQGKVSKDSCILLCKNCRAERRF